MYLSMYKEFFLTHNIFTVLCTNRLGWVCLSFMPRSPSVWQVWQSQGGSAERRAEWRLWRWQHWPAAVLHGHLLLRLRRRREGLCLRSCEKGSCCSVPTNSQLQPSTRSFQSSSSDEEKKNRNRVSFYGGYNNYVTIWYLVTIANFLSTLSMLCPEEERKRKTADVFGGAWGFLKPYKASKLVKPIFFLPKNISSLGCSWSWLNVKLYRFIHNKWPRNGEQS